MSRPLLLVFFMLFLNGCQNGLRTQGVRTYYENGSIKEEYYVNPDSSQHKHFIYNNYRVGIYKLYYPSRNIKVYCFYKDNRKDSLYISFYENGTIKEKLYYQNGELFGEQFYYYANAHLARYAVVDGFGNVIYVQKFDSLGSRFCDEGVAVSPDFYCPACHGDTAYAEQILINTMISRPIGKHIEVYLGTQDKTTYKRELLEANSNNVVAFNIKLHKGLNFFDVIAEIVDSSDNSHKSDTLHRKVYFK
ncbi:MAG: hypothetical protein JST90_19475 [Bacteroidetes bacterium]|nr:hypothetical protein [Bacteroidota bacterium]